MLAQLDLAVGLLSCRTQMQAKRHGKRKKQHAAVEKPGLHGVLNLSKGQSAVRITVANLREKQSTGKPIWNFTVQPMASGLPRYVGHASMAQPAAESCVRRLSGYCLRFNIVAQSAKAFFWRNGKYSLPTHQARSTSSTWWHEPRLVATREDGHHPCSERRGLFDARSSGRASAQWSHNFHQR